MKESRDYKTVLNILNSLYESESNLITNMANTSAVLKEHFNFLWVGFYLVDKQTNELVLGPYQGPLACSRITFGKGVCGESWQKKEAIIVDDVHQFPGHIACSSLSNSEIVIPLFLNNEVFAVLDIDSESFSDFKEEDMLALKEICKNLSLK